MPGYVSMGHLAKSSPLFLSSNLIAHSLPLEIKRMRPVQAGSAKFQSAALQIITTVISWEETGAYNISDIKWTSAELWRNYNVSYL